MVKEGCPILSTRIQWYPLAFHRKTGQVLPSVLDLLDTNRFQWKSSFSIHDRLEQISLMLDEGVESRSDTNRLPSVEADNGKQFQCLNIVTKLDHYFWNSIDAKTSFTVLKRQQIA